MLPRGVRDPCGESESLAFGIKVRASLGAGPPALAVFETVVEFGRPSSRNDVGALLDQIM